MGKYVFNCYYVRGAFNFNFWNEGRYEEISVRLLAGAFSAGAR
jgi:hypothetical protein